MRRILFFLVSKDGRRRFAVEHWRDYGVVCTDLVTTNGSARTLADFVWSHLHAEKFSVEAVQAVGPPDMRSEATLRDWLVLQAVGKTS
jgi:hypothetical protein